MKNRFAAILMIHEVSKYLTKVVQYFNEISMEEMHEIINANKNSTSHKHLLQAGMISKHWSWELIISRMEELNFDEETCHVIINSKKLTGAQMILLLKKRQKKIGSVSIGPLVMATIATKKLTGPELITLLGIHGEKDNNIIALAKPQLEKYIEDET